ncbi:type I-F CRISPR-associated endoribonuclease Cas6/Csy4 [Veronia nyctiphanis]|uniref:type I-F CRISPR-associated endoribonuclease Cas6/Csy4 n=1 Tax=Veronia nyctiphanis TaxID=1278244 RepID=UPI0013756C92|nr:type I-F CRISPR-associated endoribonuclease Cas6/Csy4 [Veronia nyctiphanis]
MKKLVHLKVKHVSSMGPLIQALHQFFAQSMKEHGKNNYGLSFPEIDDKSTGSLVGVVSPDSVEGLLSFAPLIKLMSSAKVSFEGLHDVSDASHIRYVAFIRDRKLERGAPPQAMARMLSSTSATKEMRAKATMSRYFEQTLPQINMVSHSSKRNFTLNISRQEATPEQAEQARMNVSTFNSYGLSSYSNPVFIPVLEVK